MVVLPEPVGPVTSTIPYGSRMNLRSLRMVSSSKPRMSSRRLAKSLFIDSLSRMRMTQSSPWTVGRIETRKSMVRCLRRSLKRPSWGTRFSAMSSSLITLMRLMIVWWCRLSIGSIAC